MNAFKRSFNLSGFFTCHTLTVAIAFGWLCVAFGQTTQNNAAKTLQILHTNDIHGHIRSDVNGVGGLPFVSGFIHKIRSKRKNILVLDAGDVAAKGDLLAKKTHSKATFEAMSRIGYNAWTPGNHDLDLGINALKEYSKAGKMDRLCINLLKTDGSLVFQASKIYQIQGVRVGVIGATLPGQNHTLNFEKTAQAIAKESQRLKPQTDLIVMLAHIPPSDCKKISKIAPDVDIFVSGHSHEIIKEPIRVPATGALILQADCYAHYAGRLKLVIDTKNRRIDSYKYKLVKMNHQTISPDVGMMEWVRRKELKRVPKAQEMVGWAPRDLSRMEVGLLSATAQRKATGADISFNDGIKVLREGLPAGKLDVNTVYRAAGQRGEQLIEVNLTGSEINNYLRGLRASKWSQTQWSGFYGQVQNGLFITDLSSGDSYRVVMTQREWQKRFLNLFKQVKNNPAKWPGIVVPERSYNPKFLKITWTDAMLKLLKKWNRKSIGLMEGLQNILKKTGQTLGVPAVED